MRATPWALLSAMGAPALSKPTRADLEVVWAMLARGHAAATPSSVTNSRRRIALPHAIARAYPAPVNLALSAGGGTARRVSCSGFRQGRPSSIGSSNRLALIAQTCGNGASTVIAEARYALGPDRLECAFGARGFSPQGPRHAPPSRDRVPGESARRPPSRWRVL